MPSAVILVIAEQRNGTLNRASWEAIAAAQALAGGEPIAVAILGASVDAAAQELSAAGVAEVLAVQHEALALYTPDATIQALQAVVERVQPAITVFAHTYQTRDVAPMLAA